MEEKLDSVYTGKAFSQLVLPKNLAHPVGKIVRRLGREMLMLFQKPVGMMIYAGARHLLDQVEQLRQYRRAKARQLRQVQARMETERLFCFLKHVHGIISLTG